MESLSLHCGAKEESEVLQKLDGEEEIGELIEIYCLPQGCCRVGKIALVFDGHKIPSEESALKKNVNYELESNPSRYVQSMLLIARKVGKQWGGVCFLPTRRSNVPSHCKLDTEALAQIFLSYSERVK